MTQNILTETRFHLTTFDSTQRHQYWILKWVTATLKLKTSNQYYSEYTSISCQDVFLMGDCAVIDKRKGIRAKRCIGLVWFDLCCLMTPGLSKEIWCHVWNNFSKLVNHQTRHQATHKMGCQPGDCIWSLQSSSGVCMGMYELKYSHYHPWGVQISVIYSINYGFPSLRAFICRYKTVS